MERLVNEYFCNLFKDDVSSTIFCWQEAFPKLPRYKLEWFNESVIAEDIRKAVFSMGNFKAPGIDCLQAVL